MTNAEQEAATAVIPPNRESIFPKRSPPVDYEKGEEEDVWRTEHSEGGGGGGVAKDEEYGDGAAVAAEGSKQQSIRCKVPLVELSLENITYAPVARTMAGGSGSREKGGSWRHWAYCSWCWRSGGGGGGGRSEMELKSRKTVLHSVSASVSPYKLSAWMGPSGSGKTSLLTVAAGLISSEDDLINGSRIRVNGDIGRVPKRLVGVVWQDDLLLPNLTVEETVTFAARLKSPESISDAKVREVVSQTLAELGLEKVRHSLIGGSTGGGPRGVSGGERKRVAVAAELVARPSVLLLDEPTSGLDSTSAQNLMSTLRELARGGHSVAAVVHQPRTAIFEMFDHLVLLSRGREIYSGDPRGARACLESCPGVTPLPAETGVADWIMDVITEDEKRDGGGALPKCWSERKPASVRFSSGGVTLAVRGGGVERAAGGGMDEGGFDRRKLLSRELSSFAFLSRRLSPLAKLRQEPKFKTTFLTQLRLLTVRSMKQNRGERITSVALSLTVLYTLLTGVLWWRLPDNTNRVYERNSLMFFLLIAQSNTIVTSSMTLFHRERALLSRERAKEMYGVLPYFLAKTASDMTNTVFLPTLYGCITYWVANLRPTASAFLCFLLLFYLTISTAQSCGLFLSVTIPSLQMGMILAPAISIFLMILAGFYVPLNNLNPAISWASWLSFARYGFAGMIVNEFGGRSVPCADEPTSISVGSGDECPLPGEEVIQSMGVTGAFASIWTNVGVLVGMQILLRVSCYIQLRRSR